MHCCLDGILYKIVWGPVKIISKLVLGGSRKDVAGSAGQGLKGNEDDRKNKEGKQ